VSIEYHLPPKLHFPEFQMLYIKLRPLEGLLGRFVSGARAQIENCADVP
jgi:hypothetical protein